VFSRCEPAIWRFPPVAKADCGRLGERLPPHSNEEMLRKHSKKRKPLARYTKTAGNDEKF